MVLPPLLVDAILRRLGIADAVTNDLDGLRKVYRAWCRTVPFDNVRKLEHLARGTNAPLPGSSSLDFFEALLTLGTGGTCWAGNGALHDLLRALGFGVERAVATMLHSPDLAEPNHGSVVVTLGGVRYVTDASILSDDPLELGANDARDGRLPRVEMRGETPFILWRTLPFPDGMPCRFEKIGVDADEWHERHQRTAAWSPFNFAVAARSNRSGRIVGLGVSRRFEFSEEGRLSAEPVDRAARDRFLTDELGIAPGLVRALPDDRPIAPRPVPTPLPKAGYSGTHLN